MRPAAHAVALFDIDGTLLQAMGAGRRAFFRTLKDVYGDKLDSADFDMAGRTDLQIFRGIVEEAGIPYPSPPERRHLVRRYLVHLEDELTSGPETEVLPGVEPLLDTLSTDERWALGLVTGNLQPSAWMKLNARDLGRYFTFGAFGSDREDRNELVPIALRRLRRRQGIEASPDATVVVGDTVRDIECARAAGVSVLIVGTGLDAPDRLRAARPDVYLETLADTAAVVADLERLVGLPR